MRYKKLKRKLKVSTGRSNIRESREFCKKPCNSYKGDNGRRGGWEEKLPFIFLETSKFFITGKKLMMEMNDDNFSL